MDLKDSQFWHRLLDNGQSAHFAHARNYSEPSHRHYWRHAFSRRGFIGIAAGAAAAALGSGTAPLVLASNKKSSGAEPLPIPGGIPNPFAPGEIIHNFFPGERNDPSVINNFNGFSGLAELFGTGIGTDTKTGSSTELSFHAENRFMTGVYVAEDRRVHTGTFIFI
jgi:hypothetical protein